MTKERLEEIRRIWPTPQSGNGAGMVHELLDEVESLKAGVINLRRALRNVAIDDSVNNMARSIAQQAIDETERLVC